MRPVRPHSDAGMRIDPPVSEPMAAGAMPAATATAEPLLEPPATRCVVMSHGFHGAPIGWLRPKPPNANSTMCVLPSGIMPAASSRVSAVPVWSDTRPSQVFDPAVVCRPFRCIRSLSAIGRPCSGPRAPAGLPLGVGGARQRQRVVAIDVDERVQLAVQLRDARETAGDDFLRRGFTCAELAREFGQRAEGGIRWAWSRSHCWMGVACAASEGFGTPKAAFCPVAGTSRARCPAPVA